MFKFKWLNLQLFAEGEGDGGDSSSEGATNTGEEIPAFIPEKARETYRKAMAKTKANVKPASSEEVSAETTSTEKAHVPFADLIKSDEYKEEHKAYMDKTISDRLKKYKGIEDSNKQMRELLDMAAGKYGIDPSSETFVNDLRAKMEADDSYYEQYAFDNDISVEEAKKIVSLERKVARAEEDERNREAERINQERNMRLFQNAEICKQRFPGFDLETELQNPKFVQLCQSTNEDVVAAYTACHFEEIMSQTVQMASQRAQIQTANAIASKSSRPIEGGLSNNAAAKAMTDYSKMNLKQIREQAERWRRGE